VDGYDDDIIAATDWALTQGADILNMSIQDTTSTSMDGKPKLLDRYCDFIVNQYDVTLTICAGNSGAVPGHVINTPALSYNSIKVGSFEDYDNNSWIGDSMSVFSAYRDPSDANPPVGVDRELPEVVAVGETIESTDANGGIGAPDGGTS
jgi:hypothetical protein